MKTGLAFKEDLFNCKPVTLDRTRDLRIEWVTLRHFAQCPTQKVTPPLLKRGDLFSRIEGSLEFLQSAIESVMGLRAQESPHHLLSFIFPKIPRQNAVVVLSPRAAVDEGENRDDKSN